jgi:hypothetical protein
MHSTATKLNYSGDPGRATIDSAKNTDVRRSKKFALHVDTDRLDRGFVERSGWLREREGY